MGPDNTLNVSLMLLLNATNGTRENSQPISEDILHPLAPLIICGCIAVYGLLVYLLINGFCSYFLKCECLKDCLRSLDTPRIHSDQENYTKNPVCNIPIENVQQKFNIQDSQCAICMSTLGDNVDIAQTNCQHYFHLECIQQWQLHQQSATQCPMCRAEINVLYTQSEISIEIQA